MWENSLLELEIDGFMGHFHCILQTNFIRF